jgi:hypothetical protein
MAFQGRKVQQVHKELQDHQDQVADKEMWVRKAQLGHWGHKDHRVYKAMLDLVQPAPLVHRDLKV